MFKPEVRDKITDYKIRCKAILFSLALVLTSNLFSQNPEWIVYNTSNSGLPFNWVYKIAIDQYDNKWIGTSGGVAVYREGGVVIIPVKVEEKSKEIPTKFELYQNYPNPFNPTTTIEFDLPERSYVRLVVYDVLGREIERVVDEELDAGKYKVKFDASNLLSGVYFYVLDAGRFRDVKKMVLVR